MQYPGGLKSYQKLILPGKSSDFIGDRGRLLLDICFGSLSQLRPGIIRDDLRTALNAHRAGDIIQLSIVTSQILAFKEPLIDSAAHLTHVEEPLIDSAVCLAVSFPA